MLNRSLSAKKFQVPSFYELGKIRSLVLKKWYRPIAKMERSTRYELNYFVTHFPLKIVRGKLFSQRKMFNELWKFPLASQISQVMSASL